MKFSRQSRLLKPAEFKRVFQQAVRSSDYCFRILARVNELECARLGMAVSKKVCIRAVGRNRIKRVVRESFRAHIAGQTSNRALDFVVLPTALAKTQDNTALERSLAAHWRTLMTKTRSNNDHCNGGQKNHSQNKSAQPFKDQG